MARTAEPLTGELFAAHMQRVLPSLPDAICVAVSGGADSMALCLLAQHWAQEHHITLHALTVDHQLRPESAAEAAQVAAWLAAKKIPHRTLVWQGDKPSSNVQAAARDARYRLMADWCGQHGVRHLLLAHHLDDQAETFLIRLGRGSGVDGLAAMQPLAPRDGITLVRPLLDIPKAQLIDYLQAQQQNWVEDPSNSKPEYTRSRARALLPQLAEAGISTATLAATASHMARARDYLEQQANAAYGECATEYEQGTIRLDAAVLHTLHPEIGLRVLAMALNRMNGTYLRPRFHELKCLYDNFGHTRTLNGCLFDSQGEAVVVTREAAALASPLPVSAGENVLWDGRFTLRISPDFPLLGASVGALGQHGFAAIKDALSPQRRIGRDAAQLLPTLWHLETPLLVPHMHYVAQGAQPHWMQASAFKTR